MIQKKYVKCVELARDEKTPFGIYFVENNSNLIKGEIVNNNFEDINFPCGKGKIAICLKDKIIRGNDRFFYVKKKHILEIEEEEGAKS